MPDPTKDGIAASVLEQYLVAADWYRRCLEDVIDKRVVRGLDEARHGYDSAHDAAQAYLREIGVWTTT